MEIQTKYIKNNLFTFIWSGAPFTLRLCILISSFFDADTFVFCQLISFLFLSFWSIDDISKQYIRIRWLLIGYLIKDLFIFFRRRSRLCASCTRFQVNESFSHFKIILSCRDDKVFVQLLFFCLFAWCCWLFHSLGLGLGLGRTSFHRTIQDIMVTFGKFEREYKIYINLIMLLWSLFTYR